MAPGAITGGVDERKVLPSRDCKVCNIEQPLKSGSDIVPRDWATGVPSRATPKCSWLSQGQHARNRARMSCVRRSIADDRRWGRAYRL